jgi:hypothetical protein
LAKVRAFPLSQVNEALALLKSDLVDGALVIIPDSK